MNCTLYKKVFILIYFLPLLGIFAQVDENKKAQAYSTSTEIDSATYKLYQSLIDLSRDLLYADTDSAIVLATEAYQISLASLSTEKSATALSLVGTANLIKGKWNQATEKLRQTSKYWEEIGDTLESAKSMNNLGIAYIYKEDRDSAIYYFTKSLELYKTLGDTDHVISSFNNLGASYAGKNNYKIALENYKNALDLQLIYEGEASRNNLDIGYLNNNIGGMYLYLDQIDRAIEYFQRTAEIDSISKDIKLWATTKTNLGVCYYKKGQLNLSMEILKESLELSEKANNLESLSRGYSYLGRIYEDQNLYSSSLSAFRESLKVLNQGDENNVDAITDPGILVDIGRVYRKLYNLNEAEKNALKALEISRNIEDLESEAQASKLLSLIYEDMYDSKLALEYERLYGDLNDSLNTLIADREYLEMRTLFEADRQKQQLELQTLELARQDAQIAKKKVESRNLWLTLGSVLLLFFSALYNIYRVQKSNEKLVELNGEIKSQRDLLNIQAQKLRVVNEDMKKFSLALGHDLKQPLTTIKGYTDLIKKEFSKQSYKRGEMFAQHLDSSIQRMNSRIHHLVKYIREGESLKQKEVDLNQVIVQVSDDLQGSIQDNHAQLDIQALPLVKGDSDMLSRLFQNLISNSIKYRREEVTPKIEIRYVPNGRFNIISVTDNGAGINEKYLSTIFNLFDRGERKDDNEGTGIGLATCKRIVELHGGKIEVQSEVGIGTTFNLYFPKVLMQ